MSNEKRHGLELICLDKSPSTDEMLEYVYLSIDKKLRCVCLPSGFLHKTVDFAEYIDIAAQIDFPDGLSTTNARQADIIQACKFNAKYIDVTINNFLVENGEWDAIRKEIRTFNKICREKGTTLRAITEYRLHTSSKMKALYSVLCYDGVSQVINSTGKMIDNVVDNLIFCQEMEKQNAIEIVASGRIFTPGQIKRFKSIGINHFRINSINALKEIVET